jgi:hypothetical protein
MAVFWHVGSKLAVNDSSQKQSAGTCTIEERNSPVTECLTTRLEDEHDQGKADAHKDEHAVKAVTQLLLQVVYSLDHAIKSAIHFLTRGIQATM